MAAPKGNKFAIGNKGGRPTKYDPKYCQEIIDFFHRDLYETIEVKDEDGNPTVVHDKFGNPIMKPCNLPTKEGFALSIGVHRYTLIEWARVHEEFSDAIKMAEDIQKEVLIQNGILGNYDKTFAIFTAKNVTDMRDKKELDHTSSDGSMSPERKTLDDFYGES